MAHVKPKGSIEVICGPMYSGKSEELIRRVHRAQIARQRVICLKPSVDNRYCTDKIATHPGAQLECEVADTPNYLLRASSSWDFTKIDMIAVDEAQFFTHHLVIFSKIARGRGCKVVLSGLDTDFRGEPFGEMPYLLSIADKVTKLAAVCIRCGADAMCTQRLTTDTSLVAVGSTGMYEAVCRDCFTHVEA